MDERVLEQTYRENLEERLITSLAEMKQIRLEEAMDIYYHSKLADRIHRGAEGIQYLDHKVLAQILCDTEPELFDTVERQAQ